MPIQVVPNNKPLRAKLIDDTWFYKVKGEQLSAIEKILHPSKDPNDPFAEPAPPPKQKSLQTEIKQ